jgi:hypothetical protein
MTLENLSAEDRLAIQDLLSGYCHAIDASRADLCIGLFADDAELYTPVGDAKGRQAILAWIEGRLALRAPAYQVGHHLLNTMVAATGPNTAKVRSMFLYTRVRRDGSASAELLGTGIYEEEVRKEAGRWKFAIHRFSISAPLDDVFFH